MQLVPHYLLGLLLHFWGERAQEQWFDQHIYWTMTAVGRRRRQGEGEDPEHLISGHNLVMVVEEEEMKQWGRKVHQHPLRIPAE